MSQIREVKEATDIVELIGSRLSLQRSGGSFKGLCPFHGEKTPSFFVSEELQRYKCFGCGKTGDVFTFLEEYEGLTFYEALEYLADQAGIKLEKRAPSPEDKLRTEVMEVLDLAKEYYHFLLMKHQAGEAARKYLRERGTNNSSIKLFQLGAAPASWEGLIKYLHGKKKYELNVLEKAGLVIRNRTGRHYDRFRNRVMFPLRNARGQVVGFSGRKLPEKQISSGKSSKATKSAQSEKDAKYINTPETVVYHKSELLFGFSELKQQIRKQKKVIVVEGEFDVISSQQVHVSHIVAIKGSALTAQHVKLLSRSVDQVLLCLDADNAGIEATKKAIGVVNKSESASASNLELRVIRLPAGVDPDDLAREKPSEWRQLTKQSVTAYEFLIDAAFEKHDADQPSGKKKIMAELLPVLAGISHAVELEHYVQTLSRKLQVSTSSVQTDLDDYLRKNRSQSLSSSRSKKAADQSNARSANGKDSSSEESEAGGLGKSKRASLEKYLWFLLLHSSPQGLHKRSLQLADQKLALPGSKQILQTINDTRDEESLSEIAKQLPDDLQETVFELHSSQHLLSDVDRIDIDQEWRDSLKNFKQLTTTDQIKKIEVELERLDAIEDKTDEQLAEQEDLLKKLVSLRR